MVAPTKVDMPAEIIPAFENIQYVDDNGFLTAAARLYMDQLNQILLALISRYGWQVPNLSTNQISYASYFTPNGLVSNGINQTGLPVGTIWFDTDDAKLKVKTTSGADGTIETISSS